MKTTIDTFLTGKEIAKAARLYASLSGTGKFAKTVCEEIIKPNIDRINKALGQPNDPMYLAYAVEFVFNQSQRR